MIPEHAHIKFNGGRGALLCNGCSHIIRQDFDPKDIEDKFHYCQRCTWSKWNPPDDIKEGILLLFSILDAKEWSANDVEFHPTEIRSCRVWDSHRLNKLLPKLKELASK